MKKFKKPSTPDRSPRQLKVGEEIRHALAAALQQGDYPWPADVPRHLITVTEVRISPDLRNATVYIIPLGGAHIPETVKALNAQHHFFKNVIAHEVQLRWVPQLHFEADTSFAYAEKIEKILHDPNVVRDLSTRDDE